MVRRCSIVACLLWTAIAWAQPATRPALVVGTLHSDPARIAQVRGAGVTLATVSIAWDRFQPRPDRIDDAYAASVRKQIDAFRNAGQKVQIDLGLQYPPAWVRELPDSRYVNQYGDVYIDERPGANVVNGVFNAAIRKHQADYVAAVFAKLGGEFHAVRLGWNYYGELGYPAARYKDHNDCVWAYDANARKNVPNLRRPDLLSWYLNALVDYQKFQIATVRQHYRGRLVMMYGSWGIRRVTLEKGFDAPNQTELSLGYDFERLAKAIDDRNTAVCTTWIDANPSFGDDPPVKVLSVLARKQGLDLWAENTGRADRAAMQLSLQRARQYGVSTLVWAFEPDLFDGQHAALADLKALLEPQGK